MAEPTLQAFRNNVNVEGLGRPNRFIVTVTPPTDAPSDADLEWNDQYSYLVRSITEPSVTVGSIGAQWNGSHMFLPGDVAPQEAITIECWNDASGLHRNFWESWANIAVVNPITNTHADSNPDTYQGLIQLDRIDLRDNSVSSSKYIHYCFPTNVSGTEFNYDSVDTIESFTVTLNYGVFNDQPDPSSGFATTD